MIALIISHFVGDILFQNRRMVEIKQEYGIFGAMFPHALIVALVALVFTGNPKWAFLTLLTYGLIDGLDLGKRV